MSDVLKKLTREMEKVQEQTFCHTQGVEYTAAALAMRYGEDVERAQVAGLLHDCAKCMGNDKLLSACEKHHIPVTDVERAQSLSFARQGGKLSGEGRIQGGRSGNPERYFIPYHRTSEYDSAGKDHFYGGLY